MFVMKVVYVTLDPLKSARVRKIAYSIRRYGSVVEFNVMFPKIRLVWRGGIMTRLFAGMINYLAVILQIMFIKADVFWVANCPDILAIPVILRRRFYTLEYRSPWSLQVKQEFGNSPLVKLSAIIESIALKYAKVITLTTSKLVMRVKGYGKPIFVIPNYPLKTFRVTVSKEEFRKRHHVHSGEKVVLFVGRLSRVEGADMLCDIATKVLETIDAVFWIVGDGPFYPLLERSGKKFSNRFRLFGWRPHSEIANFVNAADVCIVPRHKVPYSFIYNEEGVSKISEYMFFGKPIVACGIAESDQYLLVDKKEMADGIIKALKGEVPCSTRRTWEDYSEKEIRDMFSLIQSGRI